MPTFREDPKLGSKVPMIKTADLNEQCVTNSKILDGCITKEKLAKGTVDATTLANKSVGTEKLSDSSVTNEKISNKAVSTEKLADGSITKEKIFNASITTEKLANESVSAEKLQSGLRNTIASTYDKTIELDNQKANIDDVGNAIERLENKIGERFIVEGDVTNLPDEEDLTSVSTIDGREVMKLNDRAYEPSNFSGKGYKILRKNIKKFDIPTVSIVVSYVPTSSGDITITVNDKVTTINLDSTTDTTTAIVATKIATALKSSLDDYDVSVSSNRITLTRHNDSSVSPSSINVGNTSAVISVTDGVNKNVRKNILTQEMINDPNTVYEIKYDFDLNGAKIKIKEGCILSFVGGSFYNGILFGNKTKIKGDSYNILPNIIANGSWDIKDVYPEWCGAIGDGIMDDYNAFVKALGFNCDILLTKNYNFNSKVLQIKREKLTIKGINEGGYRAGIKNGSIELVSSSNFITIKDIQIINNNVVEYGIFAKDSITKLILQNIYITKCAVSGFSLVNCWDTVFENCNATANNVGFDLTSCYSSSLKKCNAYYNTIGLKINKDAASYYHLTIQENTKTGALIYNAICDVFNIYAEQNGWKGTTIAEKAQIWIGHLPKEEGCYNCNMNLYLNGGKNSEMESSYNFYGEDIHDCVLNIFSLRAKEVGVTLTSSSSYNSVTTNYSVSDTITVTNNGIFNVINNSSVCKYEFLKDNTIFNIGTFAYFFDKGKFGFFSRDKKWVDMQGYPIDVINKGTSENRPANMLFENTGFRYYDTTLKKPVYYNNGKYYDALGNIPELKTIGSDDEKPINAPLGWGYFNTTLKKQMYKGNNSWVDSEGNNIKFKKSGIFSDKPITDVPIGYAYFCIDRKSTEASSNGIVIYYKGDNVWVDALGRVVE